MSKNLEDIDIDKKKLDRLKFYILKAERENLRTRQDTNEQMVEKVRKLIEEEVKKCY
ncbi:hypothetical protein [Cohnella kolymensis]|uniref:hypothetical protein n=1 Tax=Cohnella kolymensis TaxID=1590652 RepID=UPI000A6C712D|nr:hypothetical protein [Cohnella kolymensis]